MKRLVRAGGRLTEGDAPHLLEGIGVIVYDPETCEIHPGLPPEESGLRWDAFVDRLARSYEARFEGQEEAVEAAVEEEVGEDTSAASDGEAPSAG